MTKLKNLKNNTWFTRTKTENPKDNQVWIKSYYDRATNKYICINFDDINRSIALSGEKEVYTDFIF